ncbi:MAG: MFS transporter [Candidatus Gracilibacteria bacterium]|jgi:HEAT repeat protein
MLKLIEKIFNISPHELPRTAYAWFVKFLHRVGFVIGWTVLTAMFVTRFSITSLPYLFLIQALLNILGMFLFAFLHEHLSVRSLIVMCALISGSLLFVATLFLNHVFIFFAFLLLTFGIFVPQLTIFISNYLEDFFSPLECERISPIIDSSETLGGIFAGLLAASLTMFVQPVKLLYIWTFFLFLLVSVTLFLQPKVSSYHHIIHAKKVSEKPFLVERFREFKSAVTHLRSVPFLQSLFVIFLLQWIIAHLLEYQYTNVIEGGLHGVQTEAAQEEGLTQGLASFYILFNACALFVQLFVASRILKKYGTVASFMIHALMTFFSALSLFFGFGTFTTILAKNNFEISGVINRNAYEASYYALKHGTQRQVRELFEALLLPLGTIIGTVMLLFIQWFFLEKDASLLIQLSFVTLALAMVVLTFRLQNRYTKLAQNNLSIGENAISKLHAIEILSQQGHKNAAPILVKALHKSSEDTLIKVKILQMLGKIGNIENIPDILHFLNSKDQHLVLAAIKALEAFPRLKKYMLKQSFARYRVIDELKKLFAEKPNEQIQTAIIKTLAHFRDPEIVPFLLDILKNSGPKLQAASIRACELFNDPNIIYYVEPYLHAGDAFVRAQALVTLWQFKKLRTRLKKIFYFMLRSISFNDQVAACSIAGDIGEGRNELIPYLTVSNPELRLYASCSLLKLGYREAGSYLAHLLLGKNSVVLAKTRELLHELSPDLQMVMVSVLQKEISVKLHHLFFKSPNMNSLLQSADSELLFKLKEAYLCLEAYHEAQLIDDILEKRKSSEIEIASTSLIQNAQVLEPV